jgi:beta-lactamase regulating signal transducer with metallopeptidase domain
VSARPVFFWLNSPAWLPLVYALLHTLWQGAVAAGGLFLALRLIAARRANLRYGFAMAALTLVLLSGLASWALLDTPQPLQVAIISQRLPASVAGNSPEILRPSSPAAPAPDGRHKAPRASDANLVDARNGTSGATQAWVHRVAVFWLLGVGASLLRAAKGAAGAGRLRRRCHDLTDAGIMALTEELRGRLGLSRGVRFLVSAEIGVPSVMGVFWPAVLLPASMLTGVPVEQLRAILAHELAHIRRWDYLVNLGQMLVEALLFFNPFVWWISRQMRVEREACCDQLAASECESPASYVEALVTVIERGRPAAAPVLAASGPTPHGGAALDRARRLLVPGYQPALRLRWFSLAIVLTLSGLALSGLWLGTRAVAQTIKTTEEKTEPKTAEDQSAVKGADAVAPGSLNQILQALQDNAGKNTDHSPGLKILQGFFGADGSWRDVTEVLRKSVKQDALEISWPQPYSVIGGDPAFGRIKTLIVSYQMDNKTRIATFQEEEDGIFLGLKATISMSTPPKEKSEAGPAPTSSPSPAAPAALRSVPGDVLDAARKGNAKEALKLWIDSIKPTKLDAETAGRALDDLIRAREPRAFMTLYDLLSHFYAKDWKLSDELLGSLVKDGRTDFLDALISRRFDLKRLTQATPFANPPTAEWIARRVAVETKQQGESVALCQAATDNDLPKLRRLVDEGADVNGVGQGGDTPLICAVYGNHLEAAQFLLDHGAQVDKPIPPDLTPLSQVNSVPMAELLKKYGANVHVKIGDMSLLTFFLVTLENTDVTEWLVKQGLDADELNKGGATLLDVALPDGKIVGEIALEAAQDAHNPQLVSDLLAAMSTQPDSRGGKAPPTVAAPAPFTPTLPYKLTVTPEIKKAFPSSEGIEVQAVTGSAANFQAGGTYRITGVCRQHTLDHATLYVGNTADAGSEAIAALAGSSLSEPLPKGASTAFDFTFKLLRPGVLHLTVYDLDNHNKNDNFYAGISLGKVVSDE